MEIRKPEAVGDRNLIKQLSAVVFVGIEGAVRATPRGLGTVRAARMLGGLLPVVDLVAPFVTMHATDPLPATQLYLVITTEDLRIYAADRPPLEIGRWPKRSYRASVSSGGRSLDLEVERLGKVHVDAERSSSTTRTVFDLAIRYAAGPPASP